MPYVSTISDTATIEGGLPTIRAMMLEEDNDYTRGTATQYQYMYGDNFLVAPVYQNTAADDAGNDIRNNIYLPSTADIWVDYFTGDQYSGGQVLNNFDAPLWKLPLFVKNGSIIPMFGEHNNAMTKTASNTEGVDKSIRKVEFYPYGDSEFIQKEDDGITQNGETGNNAITKFTSKVNGDTAVLTAEQTTNPYANMETSRSTEFIVNVSKAPTAVSGNVAGKDVTFTKVDSLEAYEKATGNVYFYDATPKTIVEEYANADSKYAKMDDVNVHPKLRVKSTDKVDVTKNAFSVTVKGFANEQEISKNEKTDTLSAPTNLTAPEEDITPTSIHLTWDAVEGATTYDVEIDGVVNRNIKSNEFTNVDLDYLTEHTYRVRAVNKDGYSEWSNKITASTIEDPYRNVPEDINVTWNYGDNWGALDGAFDHKDGTMFHSTNAVTTDQFMILDLSKIYELDKFEYMPRQDNKGNGTVKKMKIETSIDGIHYTTAWDGSKEEAWTYKDKDTDKDKDGNWVTKDVKTVKFENRKAQYVRLSVLDSKGGFFSAAELGIYKTDESKGDLAGDINHDGVINSGQGSDMTSFGNYMGLKLGDADFQGYVQGGDVDQNDRIDAYDVSFAARTLEGGIKSPDESVSGKIQLVPTQTSVKAGETFEFDVQAIGFENVNAFTAAIPYDYADMENLAFTATGTKEMQAFLKDRTHTDKSRAYYITYTNYGDKETINGTLSLGKFTATAKKDLDFNTNPIAMSYATVVSKTLDSKNAILDNEEKPEISEQLQKLTPENGIKSVSYYNEVLGRAVTAEEIWQNGKDSEGFLFDAAMGQKGEMAEFKWDVKDATWGAEVSLPTQIILDLNGSKSIHAINVSVRNTSYGAVSKMNVKAYNEDKEVYNKDFNERLENFQNDLSSVKEPITKIVVTPQESDGVTSEHEIPNDPNEGKNHMLSMYEIEVLEDLAVDADGVEVETKIEEVHLTHMEEFVAKVTPDNARNPLYNVVSSDPETLKVIKIADGDKYKYFLMGIKTGEVTLTVSPETNPDAKKELTVKVVDTAYTGALDALIKEVKALNVEKHLYVEESYKALTDLSATHEALIASGKATQDEIDSAEVALRTALAGLESKGSDTTKADSEAIIPQERMVVVDNTKTERYYTTDSILDDDKSTIWMSDTSGTIKTPVQTTIDLGTVFKLEQVDYLPNQKSSDGDIIKYRIETSTDGKTFTPVVQGKLNNNGEELEMKVAPTKIKFAPTEARYVKFIALETLGFYNNVFASIAELNFYGEIKDVVHATDLKLDQEAIELIAGHEFKVNPTLTPTNTSDYVVWTSANPKIARVNTRGMITGVNEGKTEIIATVNIGEGKTLEKRVAVSVSAAGADELYYLAVDVEEVLNDEDIRIHASILDPLTKAYEVAAAVLNEDDPSDAEIIAAYKALTEINEIYLACNDAMVEAEDYMALDPADYDPEGMEAYQALVANVKELMKDPIANIEKIKEVNKELAFSYAGLKKLDTSSLQAMIEAADVDLSLYVDNDAKTAYAKAIADAKAVVETPVSIANIEAAKLGLMNVQNTLTLRVTADQVEAMNALLTEAKGYDASAYTDGSQATIKTIIAKLEEALANTNMSKADADAVIKEVAALSNTLEKKPVPEPEPTPNPKPEDPSTPTDPEEPGTTITTDDKTVSVSGDGIKEGMIVKTAFYAFNELDTVKAMIKDQAYAGKINIETAFDLSILDANNVKVNLDGTITVAVDLAKDLLGKNLQVIYIDDEGNVTVMPSYVKDGKIYFTTSHNSTYAIVSYLGNEPKPNNSVTGTTSTPNTGDETNMGGWLVAFAGSAAMIYVLKKRREEENEA